MAREPFAQVTVGETRLALLKDGEQAYPAMLEAIASAKRSICLETYILKDDQVGRRFADALARRARDGVEVNLLYDAWGSSVSAEYLRTLEEAGVRVLPFQPVRFRGRLQAVLARVFRRNHRKALIVDGTVAFTGGLNLSNEYASLEDGGGGWRDTHVRIEGAEAHELERLFLGTWRAHKGAALDDARYQAPRRTSSKVRIIGNHFRKDRKDIRAAYVRAFAQAKTSIHLTHAYFLPPNRVLRELKRAARRGVEVTVILAAATDVTLVLLAARGLYASLLKTGVKVFEWEGRILHAKTAVVDGRWATVGSANLDGLSLRQNLEVNAVVEDEGFAQAVERLFKDDLAHCRRITPEWLDARGPLERLVSWLAGRLRRWL